MERATIVPEIGISFENPTSGDRLLDIYKAKSDQSLRAQKIADFLEGGPWGASGGGGKGEEGEKTPPSHHPHPTPSQKPTFPTIQHQKIRPIQQPHFGPPTRKQMRPEIIPTLIPQEPGRQLPHHRRFGRQRDAMAPWAFEDLLCGTPCFGLSLIELVGGGGGEGGSAGFFFITTVVVEEDIEGFEI